MRDKKAELIAAVNDVTRYFMLRIQQGADPVALGLAAYMIGRSSIKAMEYKDPAEAARLEELINRLSGKVAEDAARIALGTQHFHVEGSREPRN